MIRMFPLMALFVAVTLAAPFTVDYIGNLNAAVAEATAAKMQESLK